MTSIYEYFFINWHRYQFHFVYVWIRTNFCCFFFTFNLKLFIKMAINSKLQCMIIPMDLFSQIFLLFSKSKWKSHIRYHRQFYRHTHFLFIFMFKIQFQFQFHSKSYCEIHCATKIKIQLLLWIRKSIGIS